MIFLKLGTRERAIDDVVAGGAQDQFPAALYIYFHASTLYIFSSLIQHNTIHIESLLDNHIQPVIHLTTTQQLWRKRRLLSVTSCEYLVSIVPGSLPPVL